MSTHIKCECAKGTHKVVITWPHSPKSGATPCCSCTVDTYRVLYGEPTFVVTPLKST